MPPKPKILGTGLRAERNVELGKLDERKAIETFLKDRRAVCNGMASTLPVLINYCEAERLPYVLEAKPRSLYSIRLVE